MFKNIGSILKRTRGYIIGHLLTYPMPFIKQDGNICLNVDEYDHENAEMKEAMIKRLVKTGFQEILDTRCFIKDYNGIDI